MEAPPRGSRRAALWTGRLALAVGVPLLAFLCVEGAARWAGFGFPTAFTLVQTLNGREVFTDNPRFSWQFQNPVLAREPPPTVLPVHKAPGTIRVAVVGSSAAMGDPWPAGGFCRQLETLLAHAYPDRRVEVINAGITAMNSHVLRLVARDLLAREPDLLIVYMGNNEVVGPYGPGTVFGPFSGCLSRIRAGIRLRGTRTGQALTRWVQRFQPGGEDAIWEGMRMFLDRPVPADDPALAAVYHHFAANLADVLQAARRRQVPVLLSTVAVNLRDSPPFGSVPRCRTAADGPLAAETDAVEALLVAQPAEAVRRMEALTAAHPGCADLWFRAGRLYEAADRPADARNAYRQALQTDTFRFRADAGINAAIRAAGAFREPSAGVLFDAGAELPGLHAGAAGREWFLDHVHFNLEGNYWMASNLLVRIAGLLPARSPPREILGFEACLRSLALTDWDRMQIATRMYGRFQLAPFPAQYDHAAHMESAMQALDLARAAADRTREKTETALRATVTAFPESAVDWVRLAEWCREQSRLSEALAASRTAVQRAPHSSMARDNLARDLAACGQADAALSVLRRDPIADGHDDYALERAATFIGDTDPGLARTYNERALALNPRRATAWYNLGLCLSRLGRAEEAIRAFRRALEINPALNKARTNLGVSLMQVNQADEAMAVLREGLSRDPDDATLLSNLGYMLTLRGEGDAARRMLNRSVSLDPASGQAWNNLALARERAGDMTGAEAACREALRRLPGSAIVRVNLARACMAQRRLREAAELYLAAAPEFPPWAEDLGRAARLLATVEDPILRRPDVAVALARAALELAPDNPGLHEAMAAALAASGRFPEAIAAADRAGELARASGQEALAATIDRSRERYRRGQAWSVPLPDPRPATIGLP